MYVKYVQMMYVLYEVELHVVAATDDDDDDAKENYIRNPWVVLLKNIFIFFKLKKKMMFMINMFKFSHRPQRFHEQ